MSLLNEAFEAFVYMNKAKVPDGYGGTKTTWTEGATIYAAVVLDDSMEARTAMAQGIKEVYTLTTRKDITLEYHEVLKRLSDGKYFRITSDGDDKKTPNSAGLNMRQVSCEEWTLNG